MSLRTKLKRSLESALKKSFSELAYEIAVDMGDKHKHKAARQWLEIATMDPTQDKDGKALNRLALYTYRGWGVADDGEYAQPDREGSIPLWKKAAKKGNLDAQNNLARCYSLGNGTTQDIDRARKWYLRAAVKGCRDAAYELGRLYLKAGQVVPAIDWLHQSAEQGHDMATFELGDMYQNGREVGVDLVKAKRWYEKASKLGGHGALLAAHRLETSLLSQ
jgi:TPR repeat protein